jgi:hypothetical protein
MKIQSKLFTVGGVIILILAIGITVWRVWPSGGLRDGMVSEVAGSTDKPATESSISGQQVTPEVAQRRPMAVVVENHPDSRPQSGVSQAEVVYEMVAEGGITRYLALYQPDADSIGPVRSARDYFAELADSWSAVFAHVGGSPEVISGLRRGAYPRLSDLDEFYKADYFERVKKRPAPHNTYTSTEKLLAYAHSVSKGNDASIAAFQFTESLSIPAQAATNITLNFSLPSFKVTFAYDTATNTYLRTVAGAADKDAATQTQVAPRTVIVQLTDIVPVPGDDKFRVDIRTTGTGKAYIFQNGGVTEAAWKRQAGRLTEYYDVHTNPITMQPGQIWVALVPKTDTTAVTWTQQ